MIQLCKENFRLIQHVKLYRVLKPTKNVFSHSCIRAEHMLDVLKVLAWRLHGAVLKPQRMINTYLASGDTVTQPIVQFIMTCIKSVSQLEDQALINYASSHSSSRKISLGLHSNTSPRRGRIL